VRAAYAGTAAGCPAGAGQLINATFGGGSRIVVNGRMSLISLMLIGYLECSYLLNMRILLFRSGGQIA
jgi:hypothetical protein